MVLDDVRMLQVFEHIYLVLDRLQLLLALPRICPRCERDRFYRKQSPCLQIQRRVDFAKGALADQGVFLILYFDVALALFITTL